MTFSFYKYEPHAEQADQRVLKASAMTDFQSKGAKVKFINYTLLFVSLFVVSCQRELPCYDCEMNKRPVAHAGFDQKIIVPQDSVVLDGSLSTDVDGLISKWYWSKIAGPAAPVFANATATATVVKKLTAGIYLFELEVTDNKGASGRDTVKIIVSNPAANQPPVACAGADQTIMLPVNQVILNASCSTDPDSNIDTYNWFKISGPDTFNIVNGNNSNTSVTALVKGVYQFGVKVTDTDFLSSTDTVKIVVDAAILAINCGESNRPVVSARLVPFAQLSEPVAGMAVVSAGNKIIFTGAAVSGNPPNYGSDKVYILDISTKLWSTTKLSEWRADVSAVTAGNKVFIAGGRLGNLGGFHYFSTVDIYDITTDTWSVANLTQPRAYIAAAAVGNKVFFAGGEQEWPMPVSDRVDIYDLGTNIWSQTSLSLPRNGITAVTVNNKIFFAGGSNQIGGVNNVSKIIDVYDNANNSWSASSLSEGKAFFSGIRVGDKVYWAGGDDESGKPSCKVEVKDLNTQASSLAYLFHPFNYIINEGQNAVVTDNKIVWFATPDPLNGNHVDKFNIYNTLTKTWSIGLLPFKISGASVIAVGNTIYVAGGYVNGKMSDQVWTLEL